MKITLIANNNGSLLKLCYTAEKVISIGRDVGNTIAPLSVEGLSRQHAKIYEKDNKWFLEDLGSMNGTYRLGQKVEGAVELAPKDMLQFGKFIVSVDEIASDDDVVAPVSAVPPVVEAIKSEEPSASAVAPAVEPVAEVTPAVAPVEGAQAAPQAAAAPASPLTPAAAPAATIRRPQLPSMKSGLKLPPKPGLGAGLKLPPKPGLASGLKLPPKPGLGAGLKLPPKASPAPVAPADGVAELTPVE